MFNTILLDAPIPWQIGFQEPGTPVMEGIINFHHDLFFFLVGVLIFVLRCLNSTIKNFSYNFNKFDFDKNTINTNNTFKKRTLIAQSIEKEQYNLSNNSLYSIVHSPVLEIIWTVIPAFILVLISIPSFTLLYTIDEVIDPLFTLKIIAHQWYWNYEFITPSEWVRKNSNEIESIFANFTFDSYMLTWNDFTVPGQLRLLEVDNPLFLPTNINIRLCITAGDVLHSWGVPSLGVKVDSCPGRLNQTNLFIQRESTFYGQCSELCGINHAFMPIVVHAKNLVGTKTASEMATLYPIFMGLYYPVTLSK